MWGGKSPSARTRSTFALLHRVWGADFGQRVSGLAIKSLQTPIRAPRANSIAERWVGTARRECLDHLIPINEGHLRRVLAEFVDYYNHDRPHRSLGLQTPFPSLPSSQGEILVRRVLGGLHHVYDRAA